MTMLIKAWWSRWGTWLTMLAFVGLAIEPLLFIGIAAPVAVYRLLQTGQWIWWQWFVAYAVLGVLSQFLVTPPPANLIPTLAERAGWWIGTALLGMVIILACQVFFQTVRPQRLAWILLLGLLANGLLGLQQYLTGMERVAGWTVNPNLYGLSAVVLAALVALMGDDRQRLSAGLLSAAMVFLSGSRAAFLAWGVLLLLMAQSARWLRAAISLAALAILIMLLVQPQWFGRIGTDLTLDHITTLSRLEIWQVALQAFLENPLAGIGIHQFHAYYQHHLPPNALDPYATHAHNLWLQLLAETGILGTLGFGLLWGMVVIWLLRQRAWFTLIFVALVFGLNLIDGVFFSARVYYLLWVGVGWQYGKLLRDDQPT